MTNREAFNQFIRMNAEKQIRHMEAMADGEMVRYTIAYRDYGVHVNIGDKLCYFKAMTAGMPVGNAAAVTEWLAQEAPENINWDNMI